MKLTIFTKRQPRGFTIVELAVYVGFISMLSIALVNLVLIGNRQQFANEEKQFLREAVVNVFEQLQDDVDAASAIVSPSVGNNDSSLSLTISGQLVVYTLSSGRLQRQVGVGTPEILTPEITTITNLLFGNYGALVPGALSVSFSGNDVFFSTTFTRNDE